MVDVSKRTARRLLLPVTAAVTLLVAWRLYTALASERNGRHVQQERFAFLTLGMPRATVLREAGTPNQTCRGGEPVRLLKGQVQEEAAAALDEEEVLRRLEQETAEVLVYQFPKPSAERRRPGCGPAYLDTAIGLDASGNVLWFTILRGEDMVRHASRFLGARHQRSPS